MPSRDASQGWKLQRHRSLRAMNTMGVEATATRYIEIERTDRTTLEALVDFLHGPLMAEPLRESLTRSRPAWPTASPTASPPVTLDDDGDAPPRPFILGGGSNVLFTRDLVEPVLRWTPQLPDIGARVLDHAAGHCLVEVDAGVSWDAFVDWTLSRQLGGVENLALIPGTCGAAPWQNIGAYGVEVGERIVEVDAVDLTTGRHRTFDRSACRFGYRSSVFKVGEHGPAIAPGTSPESADPVGSAEPGTTTPRTTQWLIVRLRMALSTAGWFEPRLDYGGVREALASTDAPPTAHAIASAIRAVRRRKLPDPARVGNAGSFFKNPVIPSVLAEHLRADHPGLPVHPIDDGDTRSAAKLSAAWLIERSGLKGWRVGDAGVSAQHALVLVNHGHATGAQVLAVADEVRRRVHDRFGIVLEIEPVVV